MLKDSERWWQLRWRIGDTINRMEESKYLEIGDRSEDFLVKDEDSIVREGAMR